MIPRFDHSADSVIGMLFDRQIGLTPKHETFLRRRLAGKSVDHLRMAERIGSMIIKLAGAELDQILLDYDWICKLVLTEEFYFRRNGAYRLSKFEDAVREVYSDRELMGHYMNGLLISQLWWPNHTESYKFYVEEFLNKIPNDASHLEVGPGHGLLLAGACELDHLGTIEAWDVSEGSIENTRTCLLALGIQRPVTLVVQDLLQSSHFGRKFGSIVLSEVLEHLEAPAPALQQLRHLLTDDGRLYINMPINSPAPDHLFLLSNPEAVVSFVQAQGFAIENAKFFAGANLSLEQARGSEATISCALVARRV
jgi:2-polyprenyl-3-methyl-5-hydroxy-6-metoxy-1,4-benzoquinol methylase